MGDWEQPYRRSDAWGGLVNSLGALLATGLGIAFACCAGLFAIASLRSGSALGALILAVSGGLAATLGIRSARTALLIGPRGVRIVWPLFTRTFPWDRVAAFATHEFAFSTRLTVELTDGTVVPTPVQLTRTLLGPTVRDGGVAFDSDTYEELLVLLRARLTENQGPQGHGARR